MMLTKIIVAGENCSRINSNLQIIIAFGDREKYNKIWRKIMEKRKSWKCVHYCRICDISGKSWRSLGGRVRIMRYDVLNMRKYVTCWMDSIEHRFHPSEIIFRSELTWWLEHTPLIWLQDVHCIAKLCVRWSATGALRNSITQTHCHSIYEGFALYYENVCATMSDISWSNWCARHTANYISSMTYHNLHHILYKNDFITNGISASAYTRPTTHHHSPATHLILNHHKL